VKDLEEHYKQCKGGKSDKLAAARKDIAECISDFQKVVSYSDVLEQDRSLGSTAQVPNYDEIDVDRLGFDDEANNILFAIENTTKISTSTLQKRFTKKGGLSPSQDAPKVRSVFQDKTNHTPSPSSCKGRQYKSPPNFKRQPLDGTSPATATLSKKKD
jgi:hypothetical protein